MQHFRLLPAVIAITLCASPLITRADDTPQQAAAREALMQQMNNADIGTQQTNVPAVTPPPIVTPPPPVTPLPMTMNPPPATPPPMTVNPPLAATTTNTPNMVVDTNAVVQYPVNPAVNAAPQTNSAPLIVPPVTSGNPTMLPVAPANPTPATKPGQPAPPNLESLTAPPVPISASQQQELEALLSQYEANQISPVQYQTDRAKILAGQ